MTLVIMTITGLMLWLSPEEILQLMRKQEQNKNLSVRDLQSYEINGQSHTSTL